VLDAEKVGETLMDITPGLPGTDNFQHWPPWRQLVVETAVDDTTHLTPAQAALRIAEAASRC
jgi:hypothetical protein